MGSHDMNSHESHEKGEGFIELLDSYDRVPTESQWRNISQPAECGQLVSIHAGPGCGKTLTLAHRVAFMMKSLHFEPEEILILSMSNRSVFSLQEALSKRLGNKVVRNVHISTFHSFCRGLVENYGPQYYDSFHRKRLMDDVSWKNFARLFLRKHGDSKNSKLHGYVTPLTLERLIFSIKNGDNDVERAAKEFNVSKDYVMNVLKYMEENGILRYNDLLIDALNLVQRSIAHEHNLIPQVAKYKAVVVDEFQDMYPQLVNVIKAIVRYPTLGVDSGSLKHLTIAGDINQSIYEFLGSSPFLMKNIERELPFSKVKEVSLEESFRLTPEILYAADEVCIKNNGLYEHYLKSMKDKGYKPVIKLHASRKDEQSFVASEITRLICELGGLFKPWDFTILARSNRELDEMSKLLVKEYGYSCNRFTLSPRWINSKLHTFLDILNVLENSQGADFGFLSILLVMDKKSGNKRRLMRLLDLYNKTKSDDDSFEDFLRHQLGKPSEKTGFSKIYKFNDHEVFIKKMNGLMNALQQERESVSSFSPRVIMDALYRILSSTDLLQYINELDSKYQSDSYMKQEEQILNLELNLKLFMKSLEDKWTAYQTLGILDESFIEYFLKTYNDDMPTLDENMINLSTIHMAKGLEFPVVFILGMDDYFKARSSFWDSLLVNDYPVPTKARLYYVALTRAKNLLYVGTAKHQKNLSNVVTEAFTSSVPQFEDVAADGSYLHRLSRDMSREMPSSVKIMRGKKLYTDLLKSGKLHRAYSTSSPFNPGTRLILKSKWQQTFYRCLTSSIRVIR